MFFETEPFVIGLHCGSSKPRDIFEYMKELVSELKVLETGLSAEGVSYPVCINVSCVTGICDAPARAYIRKTNFSRIMHVTDAINATRKASGRVKSFSQYWIPH